MFLYDSLILAEVSSCLVLKDSVGEHHILKLTNIVLFITNVTHVELLLLTMH